MALVAAMGVVLLVAILALVTVAIARTESSGTGQDRQRSSAIAQAEAQLDVAVGQIQSDPVANLYNLCGTHTTTTGVGSDTFSVHTTVTFYPPGTGSTPVDCTAAALQSTRVGRATIKSSASAQKLVDTPAATRTMETEIQLTPNYKVDLDKAIFSQSNLSMSNKTNLTSASGTPNADIYTNGNFTCSNNEDFQGSIYAQGNIDLQSQCTVAVDVWAGGHLNVTNPNAAIGGRALAYATTAAGGYIFLDKATLGQQARSRAVVTSGNNGACDTAGKCFSNDTGVTAPPTNDFPHLVWDGQAASDWAANGYTNVVTFPSTQNVPTSTGVQPVNFSCGNYTGPDLVGADGHSASLNGKADGVGAWLYAMAYNLPGPTVVVLNPLTCSSKVTLQGIGITLNHNLIIMSGPGIIFTGNTPITSVAGTGTTADPNLLYLIQPYSYFGTTTVCSGEGITLDNQVTVDATVNSLLYSPCAIRKANQSTLVGQVYSGSTVTVDNQLDMTYQQLPVWGGLAGVTSSSSIASYNALTMYKRETQ